VGNKTLSEDEEQKVQCEHTSSTPPAEDSCPPPTSSDNILNSSSCHSNNSSSSIDSFQLGSVTSVLEDSVGGQEEACNILLQVVLWILVRSVAAVAPDPVRILIKLFEVQKWTKVKNYKGSRPNYY
jgi:hypothetical protein